MMKGLSYYKILLSGKVEPHSPCCSPTRALLFLISKLLTVPDSWIWLDRFSDPLYTILAVLLRIRFSASASPRNTYGVVLQNAREESPLICQPIKPFADKFRQELMWRPTILSPFKTKVQHWACLYMLISSAPATQVLLKIPYKNRKLSQNL